MMRDGWRIGSSPALRWALFLILLVVAMGWAVRNVLARSEHMKIADASPEAFSTAVPGTSVKAVVRIDQIAGKQIKATMLARVSDSLYRKPSAGASTISTVLSSDTSIVMGNADDVVPGAIVQLAGTLDNDHVLRTRQIVILTGYVHLEDESR